MDTIYDTGGNAVGKRIGNLVRSNATFELVRGNRTYSFNRNSITAVDANDYEALMALPEIESVDDARIDVSGNFGESIALQVSTGYPLVSVVMANHNYSQYVGDAIKSVRDNTFKDFEIVVVNDASTDDSIKSIFDAAGKDQRVTVIDLPKNLGVCRARNIGINASKGDLIAFLDADDLFMPDRLEKQVIQFMEDKSLDFLWGDAETVTKVPHPMMISSDPDIDKLISRCYIPACSVMVRKTWLHRVGLYNQYKAAEDWDLYVRFLANGANARYVPGVTYKYRLHNNNKTKIDSAELNSQEYMDVIRNNGRNILKSKECKNPVNVLFVLPDSSKGGASIATLGLIEKLDKQFVPFVYIMSGRLGNYVPDELDRIGVGYTIQKEEYIHVPVTGKREDVDRIKECMIANDISLLHNIIVVAARVAANELGIPVVQVKHQVDYSMPAEKNESLVSICYAGTQSFNNTYIVPNGIDTVYFARDEESGAKFRKSLGIGKKNVLVWIGRVHPDKGTSNLIKFVDQIDNGHLLFLPIHVTDSNKKIVNSIKGKNVTLLDERDHNDLVELYSAADVVLNTSVTEGNSLVLLEGMSCGCVPAALAVGGIPEIVINGYSGILAESVEGLCKSINDLYSSGKISEFSKRCRQSVIDRFDINNMVSRFEDIYRETIVRGAK